MATNEHMKYYNSKGEEVPSVTTVLKLYGKQLEPWANFIGKKGIDYKSYLNEKAALGTYIHSICEKFFSPNMKVDTHPDTNFVSIDDYRILLSRFEYFRKDLESKGYEPYAQELSIHGETYGGTIDLLFYNKTTDKYLMVDLKTSKSTYSTMYMQLMAYRNLLIEKMGIIVSDIAVLLIMRDPYEDKGFCDIIPCDDFAHRYFYIFGNLLNIYYLLTDSEKRKLLS